MECMPATDVCRVHSRMAWQSRVRGVWAVHVRGTDLVVMRGIVVRAAAATPESHTDTGDQSARHTNMEGQAVVCVRGYAWVGL